MMDVNVNSQVHRENVATAHLRMRSRGRRLETNTRCRQQGPQGSNSLIVGASRPPDDYKATN